MYFSVPEGTTKLNVHGNEFEVNAGIIEVADQLATTLMPHLKAHGCKPSASKVIEVVTEPRPKPPRSSRGSQAQPAEGDKPEGEGIPKLLGTDPLPSAKDEAAG